jgi:hypothetical protein
LIGVNPVVRGHPMDRIVMTIKAAPAEPRHQRMSPDNGGGKP